MTYNNHSTAKSSPISVVSIDKEVNMMRMMTILELGMAGRANMKTDVSTLQYNNQRVKYMIQSFENQKNKMSATYERLDYEHI